MKSFDEKRDGQLYVEITESGEVDGQVRNLPTVRATVLGLDAARAWLDQHGGYASIKATYGDENGRGSQLIMWDVYRVYPGYGHRCCGHITPARGEP